MSLRPPEDATTEKTLSGVCDQCKKQALVYRVKVTYINGKSKILQLCYRDRYTLRERVRKGIGKTHDQAMNALERQIAQDARRA